MTIFWSGLPWSNLKFFLWDASVYPLYLLSSCDLFQPGVPYTVID